MAPPTPALLSGPRPVPASRLSPGCARRALGEGVVVADGRVHPHPRKPAGCWAPSPCFGGIFTSLCEARTDWGGVLSLGGRGDTAVLGPSPAGPALLEASRRPSCSLCRSPGPGEGASGHQARASPTPVAAGTRGVRGSVLAGVGSAEWPEAAHFPPAALSGPGGELPASECLAPLARSRPLCTWSPGGRQAQAEGSRGL